MADINMDQIPIPKFYAGRHLLVSGGSGFIGKVLIEKILRSCPDVAGVHLILREKKGVAPADRIKAITDIPLFDVLRKQNPNFEEKLHPVNGDASLPGFGLSNENRQFLVNTVSIVFHVAATVRFDDPLHSAILLNVRGTRDLALMAKEMPNLAVFVHVSTTYCNVDRRVIDEKIYPPHGNWEKLIEAAEKLDPPTMNIVTAKLMGFLPNTYTFSKSLAEHCVNDVLRGKPLVILRPAIVISTLIEPFKGWIDNFNGPAGLLVACGKGVVHINLGRTDLVADFLPVDLVAKGFLLAAYRHGTSRTVTEDTPVYNISSATVKPVTTGQIREMAQSLSIEYPLDDILMEPLGIITTSQTMLLIGTIILHMIPAILIDTGLRLIGKKPMLVKIQRRIYAAQHALAPFLLNAWVFKNDKAVQLDKTILNSDLEAFKVDYRELDIFDYFRSVTIGGRRYLLKEKDENLPKAREHRLRVVIICRTLLVLCIAWLIYITPFIRIFTALSSPVVSLFNEENYRL